MTSPAYKPTLREQLDAVRPDSDDLRDDDFQEASQALQESDSWREVFERQQSFDREVTKAMQQVDLPDGLKTRLLESLAATEATGAVVSPAGPPSPSPASRRRTLQWAASAAGLLLAVALGWLIWSPAGSQLTLAEARHDLLPTGADGRIDLTEWSQFDDSFPFALPDTAWERRTHMTSDLKGLDWTGDGQHDGALYPFQVGRIRGYLLVLPASRLVDSPTARLLSTTGMDYHPVANAAWVNSTNDLVYICFVEQGDLEELQRLLRRQAA